MAAWHGVAAGGEREGNGIRPGVGDGRGGDGGAGGGARLREDALDERRHPLNLDRGGRRVSHERQAHEVDLPRELYETRVGSLVDALAGRVRAALRVVVVVVDLPEQPLAQPRALAPRKLGRVAKLEGGVNSHRREAEARLQRLREVGVPGRKVLEGEGGERDGNEEGAALHLLEEDPAHLRVLAGAATARPTLGVQR